MLIDWFTVGAQLLNFLILVWLMKRFLYQPVLDVIATREQKIAAELADAAASKSEAQKQQDEFRQKNRAFDKQRADLMRQASEAATTERERLQLADRDAADAAKARRAKSLQIETQQLHAEIARHAQDQVLDISRRVLGDLASVRLDQQACEVFIQRLRAIDGAVLATLGKALAAASDADPALLRSAFELPAAQRAAIQGALDETLGRPVPLKFDTAPELVSGIELSAQGQKLAWSISDYLDTLSLGLEERPSATELS